MSLNFWNHRAFTKFYYRIKPVIPRRVQIILRRAVLKKALPRFASVWPIDESAGTPPVGWKGWPKGKQFALVLTHDVESERGLGRCRRLAEIEMGLGFRSSFNFVLKKYETPDDLRNFLNSNGFEVGVHGCYHDGKKFSSWEIFQERAKIINRFLADWGAEGFRSPSMLCNLEWIGELDILYDLSTFDTDPFEPQQGGVSTIFPFVVSRKGDAPPFVEMPYTLPQDFTPYVLLGERTPDIWKKKLDWIAEKGGMALVNVHPDYMAFEGVRPGVDEYPSDIYEDFLLYLKERYEGRYHHCLPGELARYYLDNVKSDKNIERGETGYES